MSAISVGLRGSVLDAFARHVGGVPELLAAAPGRVNLIGEHTDYNDGFVLPCAIGRHTLVAARRRDDPLVRMLALDLDQSWSQFTLDAPIERDAAAPWSNYVRGVAASLQRRGVPLVGADLIIAGDVPLGAGLSSSAALEMAAGLALSALAGYADVDRATLALAGQRSEHEYAGCQCGIMDQWVSAHAVEGHALLLDCRALESRPIPMPADLAVLIVHSGIQRGLVEGHYDARRAQCQEAVQALGVRALRDADAAALERAAARMSAVVRRRARHVVSENLRTQQAAIALERGDLSALGRLMAESHASMRDDFEITRPAIDRLAEILQEAIGSEGGARMTGGGFGGAVVALMPKSRASAAMAAVRAHYRTPTGAEADMMLESAAAGARLLPM